MTTLQNSEQKSRQHGHKKLTFAKANGTSAIACTCFFHMRAWRLKPAPGTHSGTYFTDVQVSDWISQGESNSLTDGDNIHEPPSRCHALVRNPQPMLGYRYVWIVLVLNIDPIRSANDHFPDHAATANTREVRMMTAGQEVTH